MLINFVHNEYIFRIITLFLLDSLIFCNQRNIPHAQNYHYDTIQQHNQYIKQTKVAILTIFNYIIISFCHNKICSCTKTVYICSTKF